ncbi:hypothetical protein VIN30_11065, partial [Adlercreutzia sp. R7]|nr:hypothetical protein [Adlercreutzia sp. R7]
RSCAKVTMCEIAAHEAAHEIAAHEVTKSENAMPEGAAVRARYPRARAKMRKGSARMRRDFQISTDQSQCGKTASISSFSR